MIDEILSKSYRYFNQLSIWNLEDRIPESLISDKAQLATIIDQYFAEVIGDEIQPDDEHSEYWQPVVIRNKLRATQRQKAAAVVKELRK